MTDDTPPDPQPLTTGEIALIRKRHAAERAIDSRSVTEERLLATLDARPSGDEALRAALSGLIDAAREMDDGTTEHGWAIRLAESALDALAAPVSQPEVLDVERLAWALADEHATNPGDVVETTEGPVSAIDYPEEWYDTPRNIAARAIAALAAPVSRSSGGH